MSVQEFPWLVKSADSLLSLSRVCRLFKASFQTLNLLGFATLLSKIMGPAKGASASNASRLPAATIAKAINKVSTRSTKDGNSLSLSSASQPKGNDAKAECAAKQSGENSMSDDEEMQVDPVEGSNGAGDEESSDYEGDFLDDLFEKGNSAIVPFCYVLFDRMYAEYIKQIIEQIGQDIGQDPALKGCEFVVDHDRPVRNNPDLWRLCVAFTNSEHCALFQSRKVVEVLVDGGKRKLSFTISQPNLSWANSDGKIRLFVKNVPAKKLTLAML